MKDAKGRWRKTAVTLHGDTSLQELLTPLKVEADPRRKKGLQVMLAMVGESFLNTLSELVEEPGVRCQSRGRASHARQLRLRSDINE